MGRSTEEASSVVQSTEEASSAVQPASDNTEPGSASSALQPAEPFGRTDPGGHSDDKDLPFQYVADGTDRFGPYQVHHTRSGTNSPYQLELQKKSAQEMAVKAKPPSNFDKGGSAEQPVTPFRTAEQPLSSSEQLFIIPEILQPIKAALAEEIAKFEVECEQWDTPNFGEAATQEDKPKFLMAEVYKRLRSRRVRECLPAYTAAQIRPIYAVIKGLLALLHSDVHASVCRSSQKKQIVANDLYADCCSHGNAAKDATSFVQMDMC